MSVNVEGSVDESWDFSRVRKAGIQRLASFGTWFYSFSLGLRWPFWLNFAHILCLKYWWKISWVLYTKQKIRLELEVSQVENVFRRGCGFQISWILSRQCLYSVALGPRLNERKITMQFAYAELVLAKTPLELFILQGATWWKFRSLMRMALSIEVLIFLSCEDLCSFLNESRLVSQRRHMVLMTDWSRKQLHPVVLFNFAKHSALP